MPVHTFPLTYFFQKFESGLILGESLRFSDVARIHVQRNRLRTTLDRNIQKVLEAESSGRLHLRRTGSGVEYLRHRIALSPAQPDLAWREPVYVDFPILRWTHYDAAQLVRIPALGIEIIAPRHEALDELLSREIRLALARHKQLNHLHELLRLRIPQQFALEARPLSVRLPTLKQRAIRRIAEEQDKPPILPQVATEISGTSLEPAYSVEATVDALADAFTGKQPRSVLLVGPSGVGKSAAFRELVRRRYEKQLGSTPFFQSSGARLVAGMSGFGMWQERCQEVRKEAARRGAILHLGNLIELMEVGKSSCQRTGIAGFFRPYIARGELRIVVECTPEQLSMIERDEPQLLDAFLRVEMTEPDGPTGKRILESVAAAHSPQATITPRGLDTLDRLHRRYATYSVYPGRPLRFLRDVLNNHKQRGDFAQPIDRDEILSEFTRETGLPRVLLDPGVPLDLPTTTEWFASRVLGQSEAVQLIVDLLAMVKAGLSRPQQPIASLMFVGPTGVGKTEMAKALAEFLFGSRDRLTRFDMSEYADPIAVQRLVGYGGREGILTARVREQPFSVLLFDEFEKAHPAFFDLLLQVLSAARLSDSVGRIADFRNTVIIMTSNLGAESYQQGSLGWQGGQPPSDARDHFLQAVRKVLRPEMVNRFDRIVPFLPLSAEEIANIARREWQKIQQRDGVRQRGIVFHMAADVLAHLAQRGFDPRYGARPLKRAMERELLAPLAHQANRYRGEQSLHADLRIAQSRLQVEVRPRRDEPGRLHLEHLDESPLAELVRRMIRLRRKHQRLERCTMLRELNNEIYQLERRQRGKTSAKEPNADRNLARMGRLRQLRDHAMEQIARACSLEENSTIHFYERCNLIASSPGESSTDSPLGVNHAFQRDVVALERQWDELLLQMYQLRMRDPAGITLAMFAEERDWMFELARAYRSIAEDRQESLQLYVYRPVPNRPARDDIPLDAKWEWDRDVLKAIFGAGTRREIIQREVVSDARTFLQEKRDDVIGMLIRIAGAGAHLRYGDEAGVHLRKIASAKGREAHLAYILTSEGPALNYVPPLAAMRRGGLNELPRRRTYDPFQASIDDAKRKEPHPLNPQKIWWDLSHLIDEHARHRLEELILE